MKIYDLFESPKLGGADTAIGAQSTADQHSPSPVGSGTSRREAKKKPVTMMGVGVKENVNEGLRPGEYYQYKVYFDDGTSTELQVTSDEFDFHSYYAKRGKNVDKVELQGGIRSDFDEGVAEAVEVVDQDYDLDQMIFTLNVDGKKISFTYWDYENNFQSPNIKDIYQQAREQLGKKLSPEQVKAAARAVFKSFEQGVAEAAGLYGPFTVTINTGERPTSRTKTKKFRREDDAILWTEDWFEDFPQYVFATAEITDPEGNVVWYSDETMVSGKDVAEAVEVVDQDYDLDQMIFTLNVDGKKISFTYWDYEEDFANADINEIRTQVAERLGQLPDQQQEQVAQAVYTELRQNLDEAGPFSYGAKKPRRGSVADLAAKKRREQERGQQPVEPRDQMVGVAKVLPKDVSEGKEDLSKYSTERLQDYVKKVSGGGVPAFGSGAQLKRVQQELKRREQGVAEGSTREKLHQRHQELRKKSGLPDPDYYKELKATYDLPDQERYAKAAELKKKYNIKEGILDRAAPKMPKPRNPAEKILTAKRTSGAAGKHVNKKRQSELQPKHKKQDDLMSEEIVESRLDSMRYAGYDIIVEEASLCPECGGVAYADNILAEKQDACYHKVKSRYKVWPSAYASGALVRCRKKGAKNWGNKSKK